MPTFESPIAVPPPAPRRRRAEIQRTPDTAPAEEVVEDLTDADVETATELSRLPELGSSLLKETPESEATRELEGASSRHAALRAQGKARRAAFTQRANEQLTADKKEGEERLEKVRRAETQRTQESERETQALQERLQQDAEAAAEKEVEGDAFESRQFISKTEAYLALAERMRAINEELADLQAFNSKESARQQAVLNAEAKELSETFVGIQNATGETTGGRVANPFYKKPEAVRAEQATEKEAPRGESREELSAKYEALKKENEDVSTRMRKLEELEGVYAEQYQSARDRRLALQASMQNAFGYFRLDPSGTKYQSAQIESGTLAKYEAVAQQARELIREYYPPLMERKRALMEELMDVVDRLEATPALEVPVASDEQKAAEISAAIQQGGSKENVVIPLTRKKKTQPPMPPASERREAA